jgi:hypothetical protein
MNNEQHEHALNTIVGDLHHRNGMGGQDFLTLKDMLDKSSPQQYKEDLAFISGRLKGMGDDPTKLGFPELIITDNSPRAAEKQAGAKKIEPVRPPEPQVKPGEGSLTPAPETRIGSPEARAAHGTSQEVPGWLKESMEKHQQWLPENIQKEGIEGAYRERMQNLPTDVQSAISKMDMPHWMVGLMPNPASMSETDRNEMYGNIKQVADMSQPGSNSVAARAETLLGFAGAAKLPTPGDLGTGKSLTTEGCTSAISHYVLSPLKAEFAELKDMPDQLTKTQSSPELSHLLMAYSHNHPGLLKVETKPIDAFSAEDVHPGSITIGDKTGGAHTFGWMRVPPSWEGEGGWRPGEYIAVGNTGLPEFGKPAMHLAQEYISPDPNRRDAKMPPHGHGGNEHGAINSYNGGRPGDHATNPYRHPGATFTTFSFGH